MEELGINMQLLEDNFVSIYDILISKTIVVSGKVEEFVKAFSSPMRLHHYPNHSEYFKLVNKLIVKTDKLEVL